MPYKRKYGVATVNGTHIVIPILIAGEQNFSIGSDWTPAAGDVKVTKDDGTPANIATLPTYVTSQGWEFQFSAAELQCKKLDVLIVDQTATKEIEDQFFSVETYGNASAMVPIDYSDIVRMGLTALPAAAADAAGGLPISDAGGLDLDTLLGYLTEAVATAAELAKVPKSDGTITWNATALASINAEADTALTDYDPLTRTEATSDKNEIITQVNANETKIDAVKVDTALVKIQTDKMTFSVTNQIDANIQYVNDIQVTGDGETGSEWGPV